MMNRVNSCNCNISAQKKTQKCLSFRHCWIEILQKWIVYTILELQKNSLTTPQYIFWYFNSHMLNFDIQMASHLQLTKVEFGFWAILHLHCAAFVTRHKPFTAECKSWIYMIRTSVKSKSRETDRNQTEYRKASRYNWQE